MENFYMSRGASKVVNTCAGIKAGEHVLIVTEQSRFSIAQALATEVYRIGAEPTVCIMEPRSQDSSEPPKEIDRKSTRLNSSHPSSSRMPSSA